MQKAFWQYIDQAQKYQMQGEFLAAIDHYKKALDIDPDYAEAWHQLGLVYNQIKRFADAGISYRQALRMYEKRLQNDAPMDYNTFAKAQVLASLHETEEMTYALEKALRMNPYFAKKTLEMLEFKPFLADESFRLLIQKHLDLLSTLQYRGSKLQKNDLTELQTQRREVFIQYLRQNDWFVEDFGAMWDSEMTIAPQATAEYRHNEHIQLFLEYYLDENLLFMELRNRFVESDSQAYRLYIQDQLRDLLQIIHQYQSILNMENWEAMLEQIIEIADSVLLEMPDGRKVKVS
ncbi:MAG: tetratricopeptide repeat protein [Microscillaceae bacterium]|jgi:tetratricopeptide (TPR) repeat protein|nr:tetratricopeptide repeat protein [Microscillaceae bacterium]